MTTATTTTTQLVAAPISAEAFSPFGWVVQPRDDGDEFLPAIEPRLEGFEGGNGGGSGSGSGGGTSSSSSSSFPRLWVMRLPAARGRRFSDIARHDKVTQTLCGLGASLPWLLAVAPAGVERPAAADLVAFAVPPRVAVTLRKGTWHAGPLFDAPGRAEEGQGGISKKAGDGGGGGGDGGDGSSREGGGGGGGGDEDKGVDFLNLELSDTNLRDRTLSSFTGEGGAEAEIEVLWPPE